MHIRISEEMLAKARTAEMSSSKQPKAMPVSFIT